MEQSIKPSYENLREICNRLGCGRVRILRLLQEGLPAVKIAGTYMMTERAYLEWLDRKAEKA